MHSGVFCLFFMFVFFSHVVFEHWLFFFNKKRKHRNDIGDIFQVLKQNEVCLHASVLRREVEGTLCTHFNLQAPHPQLCGAETPEQGSHCAGCDPHAAIKHCCPKRKINPHMAVGKRWRERE